MENNDQLNELYLSDKPKFIRWIIQYSGGLIKTEKQATYLLIAMVAIFVIVSIFIFIKSNSNTAQEEYLKNGYPKPPGVEVYEQESGLLR